MELNVAHELVEQTHKLLAHTQYQVLSVTESPRPGMSKIAAQYNPGQKKGGGAGKAYKKGPLKAAIESCMEASAHLREIGAQVSFKEDNGVLTWVKKYFNGAWREAHPIHFTVKLKSGEEISSRLPLTYLHPPIKDKTTSLSQQVRLADDLDAVVQLLADTFRQGGASDLAFEIEDTLGRLGPLSAKDRCQKCEEPLQDGTLYEVDIGDSELRFKCADCAGESPKCSCGEALGCPVCEDTSDAEKKPNADG